MQRAERREREHQAREERGVAPSCQLDGQQVHPGAGDHVRQEECHVVGENRIAGQPDDRRDGHGDAQ